MFLSIFLFSLLLSVAFTSYTTCEQRDGDCDKCSNLTSSIDVTWTTKLSSNTQLVNSAIYMDNIINSTDPNDIISFDDPYNGLHMSISYTCCHTLKQFDAMCLAMETFYWESVTVNFTNFGCNLDMHNNETIYLHALPQEYSQYALFTLVGELYNHWKSYQITVNHPRQSKFHMTLARVTHSYPVDTVVNEYQNYYFGTQKICKFSINGNGVCSTIAKDC